MNEKGFTLIEVLVALVVGAMLLGSVSWIIASLAKDLKAAERIERPEALLQSTALLEKILSEGRFIDQSGGAMQRSATNLDFAMRAPEALGQTGFVTAKLIARENASSASLVLQLPGTDFPETTVLQNMESINLSYDVESGSQGPSPFIKKIAIIVKPTYQTEGLTINIRPHVDAIGACIFDPISQQCRS